MDKRQLKALLEGIRAGSIHPDEGLERLATWPFEDLGHTRLDTQREVRCGTPEVIYGAGKSAQQLLEIAGRLGERHERWLVTRCAPEAAQALVDALPGARWHARSGAVSFGLERAAAGPEARQAPLLIVSAGTSDGPVAEEARLAAELHGVAAAELRDVGVAGLQRLLAELERLRSARALVVVAGMEGALPSVVAGLVESPVIAVPTSVGYGASFGGLAALLAMLNACAAGVSVVNIDNGFGAGCAAARAVLCGQNAASS